MAYGGGGSPYTGGASTAQPIDPRTGQPYAGAGGAGGRTEANPYAGPPSGGGAAPAAPGAIGPTYGRVEGGAIAEANRASHLGSLNANQYFQAGSNAAGLFNNEGNRDVNRSAHYADNGVADYGNANADRTGNLGALGRLQQFYQQGPGPSAAEAQMRAGADANMAQSIALAHSGRGVGNNAAAMRQAAFGNAAAGQQLNQQTGVLRAKEASDWRGQQLGAMGIEQQGYGQVRGQDIASMQANQNMGLGYQNAGQNAYAQGANAQLGWAGMGNQREMFGEGQRGTILGNQLSADTSKYGADQGVSVAQQQQNAQSTAAGVGAAASVAVPLIMAASDVRGKKDIQPANMAAVFGNGGPDLRAAQGYEYNYKDPNAPGAAPGKQVGPMAQNLPASVVHTGPDGKKAVDTSRLSLVNTAAVSELQRRTDELEKLLQSRDGNGLPQLPQAGGDPYGGTSRTPESIDTSGWNGGAGLPPEAANVVRDPRTGRPAWQTSKGLLPLKPDERPQMQDMQRRAAFGSGQI